MWFVDAAFALAVPCFEMVVTDHLPRDGATDVPVDVIPLVVVDTACGADELIVSLHDTRGEVAAQTFPASMFTRSVRPFLVDFDPGELAPDTRYTLEITVVDQRLYTATFDTGAERASMPSGAPSLEVLGARRSDDIDANFRATLGITPIGDGHVFVVAADGEDMAVIPGLGPDPFQAETAWRKRGDGRKFCLTVQERHFTGWSESSDEVCGKALGCGCQTGRAPSLLGVLVLTGLLRLRRRRP